MFNHHKVRNALQHFYPVKFPRSKSVKYWPCSLYQYSNRAPRILGQTSIFGVVFFVSKSLLAIEGQKKHEKFAILI